MSTESPPQPSPSEPSAAVRSTGWRSTLSWVTFGLWASGVAWLAARYLFAAESEFGLQVPAWAAKVLAVHGAVAMIALVICGAWLPLHVAPRLRQRGHRVTGFTQLGLLTILVATGYGLYYLAGEGSRPAWSLVHWATGLLFPAIFLVHRRTTANGRGSR